MSSASILQSALVPLGPAPLPSVLVNQRLLRFGTFQVAVIQHTKTLTSKLRIMGRTQFYHQCTSRIKDSKAQVPQAKPQTQPSKTLIHVPMIGEHQRPTIGLKPCSSLQRYAGPSSRLVRRPQKAVCRVLAGEGRNSRGGSRRKIHGSSITAVFDKDASPLDFSREAQSVCCASPLWCLSQIDAVAHSAKLQRTFHIHGDLGSRQTEPNIRGHHLQCHHQRTGESGRLATSSFADDPLSVRLRRHVGSFKVTWTDDACLKSAGTGCAEVEQVFNMRHLGFRENASPHSCMYLVRMHPFSNVNAPAPCLLVCHMCVHIALTLNLFVHL